MKKTFTTTSAILGLMPMAMAVGCGAGDVPAGAADSPAGTSSDSAAIVALGPAAVTGCNFTQSFGISSPQQIDWLANQFNNLSNLQMQLYNVDSSGAMTQVAQTAQSASQYLSSMINSASQSLATQQNVANAFNNAASQTSATGTHTLSAASDVVNAASGSASNFANGSVLHHDSSAASASQYATGAQGAHAYGDQVASNASYANGGAANNAASASNNAATANAYNTGAQAANTAYDANGYATGSNAAQNGSDAIASQNGYGAANNNAYQSAAPYWGGLAWPGIGGGFGTFSWKPMMRFVSSTSTTPNWLAIDRGIGIVATVTSALLCAWKSTIWRTSIL